MSLACLQLGTHFHKVLLDDCALFVDGVPLLVSEVGDIGHLGASLGLVLRELVHEVLKLVSESPSGLDWVTYCL